MKKLQLLAVAVAMSGGLVANNAFAAERGAFIGAEWGGSQVEIEVEGLGSDSDDDHSLVFRGGYFFTPNFAAEVFHANLYDYSEEGYSGELDGLGLGVLARKNFGADNNGFYVQGRVGMFRSSVDISMEDVGSASDKSTKPYVGVGVGYDFTRNFGLGVNYTRYRADFDGVSLDTNSLTAGVEFRF